MTGQTLDAVRFDRRAGRGHVESYFVKANDPAGRRAIWLRFTIFASGRDGRDGAALTELWAIAFDRERGHVAVKATVPFSDEQFSRAGIAIAVDGCALSREGARGEVASGDRRIAYDLVFSSPSPPMIHFPARWMYDGPLPSSKIASPIPDMRVKGSVTVCGERWDVDGWPGLLGHNWGRSNAYLYGWGHCNAWDDVEPDEAPVFEGFSGRVKIGPAITPLTTILCMWYRGVRYELNAPRDLLRNRGEITLRRWRFSGESRLARIDGEMFGTTDDFVGLYYANPGGRVTHCLNTKLASARIELTIRGRAPRLLTSRAAALEIGTHDPSHGVRMYV
jgi:hypothetical protein